MSGHKFRKYLNRKNMIQYGKKVVKYNIFSNFSFCSIIARFHRVCLCVMRYLPQQKGHIKAHEFSFEDETIRFMRCDMILYPFQFKARSPHIYALHHHTLGHNICPVRFNFICPEINMEYNNWRQRSSLVEFNVCGRLLRDGDDGHRLAPLIICVEGE